MPSRSSSCEQHVADRVGADRARAADLGAELRQGQGGAARRARRRDADLLDQLAALALGDRLDRPHQHVEHVHAHRDAVISPLIDPPRAGFADVVVP